MTVADASGQWTQPGVNYRGIHILFLCLDSMSPDGKHHVVITFGGLRKQGIEHNRCHLMISNKRLLQRIKCHSNLMLLFYYIGWTLPHISDPYD